MDNFHIVDCSDTGKPNQYQLLSDQGYLDAAIDTTNGNYEIIYYNTFHRFRRQGHGKELLEETKEHARSLGARAIIASDIMSRESLDALEYVFGKQFIDVESRGGYASPGHDFDPHHPTYASMYFPLYENRLE